MAVRFLQLLRRFYRYYVVRAAVFYLPVSPLPLPSSKIDRHTQNRVGLRLLRDPYIDNDACCFFFGWLWAIIYMGLGKYHVLISSLGVISNFACFEGVLKLAAAC